MNDTDKIKILHVAQANGGVSEYLKNFLKYSKENIFDSKLLVSPNYKNEEKIYKDLVDEIYYLDMDREISLTKDLKTVFNMVKVLKEMKPDIVYAHSSKAGAITRVATFITNTPVIYNSHGWAFDMDVSNKKKKMYVLIERLLAKISSYIVCISQNDYEKALKHNICNKEKSKLIPNGIDINRFSKKIDKKEVMNKYGIPEGKIIIGMVARISEQKSPKTFVKVAKKVCEKRNDCYFLMVGDGEERSEVEKLIHELKIDKNVSITGWVDDTSELMKTFDIALLTSKWEGFGLVIPEYFASEVPVIASSVGGIKNIINNGVNGYLVEDDNIEKYVEHIFDYIDNKDKKYRIIRNAYNDAKKKYDVKRVVKDHENMFIQLYRANNK